MSFEQKSTKTAGIIIIGNEILSGKVHDCNSYYLASELRALGVSVERILIIPDELDTIGREVSGFSEKYDYVFTSGGVGPTHDDMTMEGIARGFGVKLIRHPEFVTFFHSRYGIAVNEAILKMTELPDGAELICENNMRFPLIIFRNVYIFPGIPEYLKDKFSAIKERFRTSAFYLKRFFLNANESDIANILNNAVAENPGVVFGSYPILGNPEHKIIVTAESKSENSLSKAVKDLLSVFPENIIVRVE
jgi:molybdenum cofactor synthesis domain-containing protein